MKKLHLITKSLLFLSFFLPFFVLPTCSWNNAAAREKQIKDSLTKDSIMKDSTMQVSLKKAGLMQYHYDSINNNLVSVTKAPKTTNQHIDSIKRHIDSLHFSSNAKTDSTIPNTYRNKTISDYFSGFWEFLIHPSEETISGYNLSIKFLILPFQGNSFELGDILCFILTLSFFITLGTLIVLFFKPNRKLNLYLSIISFLILIYLGLLYEFKNALLGYYLALFLNLLDIILIYWSIRKERLIRNE